MAAGTMQRRRRGHGGSSRCTSWQRSAQTLASTPARPSTSMAPSSARPSWRSEVKLPERVSPSPEGPAVSSTLHELCGEGAAEDPPLGGAAGEGNKPACPSLPQRRWAQTGSRKVKLRAWVCPQRLALQRKAGCTAAPSRCAAPQPWVPPPNCARAPDGLTQSPLLPAAQLHPTIPCLPMYPLLGPVAAPGCAGRAFALGHPAGDMSPHPAVPTAPSLLVPDSLQAVCQAQGSLERSPPARFQQ